MGNRPEILDIEYSAWKSLVQADSLDTLCVATERSERYYIYAGFETKVLKALVAGTNYSDWKSNFKSTATVALNEDEAVAIALGSISSTIRSVSDDALISIKNALGIKLIETMEALLREVRKINLAIAATTEEEEYMPDGWR